jgi:hypothetical protein
MPGGMFIFEALDLYQLQTMLMKKESVTVVPTTLQLLITEKLLRALWQQ